jgi:eukaryotic-like serine/threonine-protein kinase
MSSIESPALAQLLAQPEHERHLGPFRLLKQLGKGGFAPVWLATEVYGETELRTVAIKLFAFDASSDPSSAGSTRTHLPDRILEEARALCRVEHPNVVRFHAVVTDPDQALLGLVMEHV